MFIPQKILERLDKSSNDINLEDRLTLDYWLKELNIHKKTPQLSYEANAWGGLLASGNVNVYVEQNGNKYNGQAVVSLRKYLISKEFKIHTSQGYINEDGIYIPKTSIRVSSDGTEVYFIRIDYDEGEKKAFFSEVKYSIYRNDVGYKDDVGDKNEGEKRLKYMILNKKIIDIKEIIANKGNLDDLISGLLNLVSVYKKRIEDKKSIKVYAISRIDSEDSKPQIYPIPIRLEEEVDDGYPHLAQERKDVYPLNSDFSGLLGNKEGTNPVKGYVNRNFLPFIGNLTMFSQTLHLSLIGNISQGLGKLITLQKN